MHAQTHILSPSVSLSLTHKHKLRQQSIIQPTNQSVSPSVHQPASELISLSATHSLSLSISQPTNQPANPTQTKPSRSKVIQIESIIFQVTHIQQKKPNHVRPELYTNQKTTDVKLAVAGFQARVFTVLTIWKSVDGSPMLSSCLCGDLNLQTLASAPEASTRLLAQNIINPQNSLTLPAISKGILGWVASVRSSPRRRSEAASLCQWCTAMRRKSLA